ncbi:hypothetical protein CVD28_05860 [Bacillus sp. M6-12]|uniref:aspartyl-phosphate phosphatase Spo0E family protein n=1 Tax=Bacillus sp. M6-12 TaxID=2054166 RepID=UPI000C78FCD5|nr:hypothetical protein CVD28_05860 [Bacillus sp. M6-12]
MNAIQCTCTTKDEILKRIQILRSELIQTGMNEGLQSLKTIKLSQKLDACIFKYQSTFRHS